jgi:hypothetical protein
MTTQSGLYPIWGHGDHSPAFVPVLGFFHRLVGQAGPALVVILLIIRWAIFWNFLNKLS